MDLCPLTREQRKELANNPKKIKYFHFNCVNTDQREPSGVITVAVVKLRDSLFAYGASACSPNDNFCRLTGRKEATRRLFEVCRLPIGSSDKMKLFGVIGHETTSEDEFSEYSVANIAANTVSCYLPWNYTILSVVDRKKKG